MGLLNHLFGAKKGVAEKLVMDDNKRMALWDKHLASFAKREEISKNFNFENVDKALQNFNATNEILSQIESLIPSELVDIAGEEKADKEILADLNQLKSRYDIDALSKVIRSVKQKQSALLDLFCEILAVLKAEIHLIRLIRKKPANVRDLLLRLLSLFFIRSPGSIKFLWNNPFLKRTSTYTKA